MLAFDVVQHLVASSVATALGTDIVIGSKAQIPGGDGPIISLQETGGTAPVERHNRVGTPYRQPSLQIVVRAKSATLARNKIYAVYDALVGVRNATIGSTFYLWIRPVQEPFDLGSPDDLGRARFAFNINAMSTSI